MLERFLIVLGVVFGSMVLHELMHGVVAYWLGDDTAKNEGRLTLNPLKHMDFFTSLVLPLLLFLGGGVIIGGAKPVPIDSRHLKWREGGVALVALAGPLVNLLLAFLSYAVLTLWGWELLGLARAIMVCVLQVNLQLFVFNMLPIPPLDGSRVLYLIAPDRVRAVLQKMEGFGLLIVILLVMVFGSVLSQVTLGMGSGVLQLFRWIMGQ